MHKTAATSAFSKRSFSPSTLMRFQIYPFWKTFSTSSVYGVRKHGFTVDRKAKPDKKLRLHIYPD